MASNQRVSHAHQLPAEDVHAAPDVDLDCLLVYVMTSDFILEIPWNKTYELI